MNKENVPCFGFFTFIFILIIFIYLFIYFCIIRFTEYEIHHT